MIVYTKPMFDATPFHMLILWIILGCDKTRQPLVDSFFFINELCVGKDCSRHGHM